MRLNRSFIYVLAASLLSGLLFIRQGFLLRLLTPAYIEEKGAYPYAVLLLGLLLLYSKRRVVLERMSEQRDGQITTFMGLSIVVAAFLLPGTAPPTQVLSILLIWVGLFLSFYGASGELPMAVTSVYAFALAFPMVVKGLGSSFPLATTKVLVWFLAPALPITHTGQLISFMDPTGTRQSYFIDAACSGSAALSIFLAIFMLMVIDIPPKWKKGVGLLIFGILGTAFQNIIRLVVLVVAGYHYGSSALWTMHTYAGYVIFPLWYAFFVYVYMRQSRATAPERPKHSLAAAGA